MCARQTTEEDDQRYKYFRFDLHCSVPLNSNANYRADRMTAARKINRNFIGWGDERTNDAAVDGESGERDVSSEKVVRGFGPEQQRLNIIPVSFTYGHAGYQIWESFHV